MPATTEPAQTLLEQTRQAFHRQCVICGQGAHRGLGLRFFLCENGEVQAEFECPEIYQGYEGLLHGGIISSLLDSAMTNCLFAHGIVAVTAEIKVRFCHPIELGKKLHVQASIQQVQSPLYILNAHITQERRIKAKGSGKFVLKPG